MPLYDYECQKCFQRFTILKPANEPDENVECPHCKSKEVKKIFSPFASFCGTDNDGCTSFG